MLRLSATPEAPLPSMRDIDVKNQPTVTEEKSRGSGIWHTETQIDRRTRCHERLIQPRLQNRYKDKISDVVGGKDARGR